MFRFIDFAQFIGKRAAFQFFICPLRRRNLSKAPSTLPPSFQQALWVVDFRQRRGYTPAFGKRQQLWAAALRPAPELRFDF